MTTRPVRVAAALAGIAAAALTGCGDLADAEAEDLATSFARADMDPGARCALLASTTLVRVQQEGPCEDVLAELPLGSGAVTAIEVWGEEAQVRLTDDTLFLTRTPDGWRVSAAACTPQGEDLPYDCEVAAS